MKISTAHQHVVGYHHLDVEELPNYKTLLNFWLYLDTLTPEQWRVVSGRYNQERNHSQTGYLERLDSSLVTPIVIIHNWWQYSMRGSSWAGWCPGYASLEIIHSNVLIEDQRAPVFLPMFENL